MRCSLILCHELHRPLFEMRPDICPYDYLSPLEMHLWELFYEDRNARSGA